MTMTAILVLLAFTLGVLVTKYQKVRALCARAGLYGLAVVGALAVVFALLAQA